MNYPKTREACRHNSALSSVLIDEFIIPLGILKNKFDVEFDLQMQDYRHITSKMPEPWFGLLKTQYMAHRILRKNGHLSGYLKSEQFQHLREDQRKYFDYQLQHPWRFCFIEIRGVPAPDFFDMIDVLTGESFLLFSPGIGQTAKVRHISLCFALIAFNGTCWQTFGPIGMYRSFEIDDISFFSKELHPAICSNSELVRDLDLNPLPYAMLISGSEFPYTTAKEDVIVHVAGNQIIESLDIASLSSSFEVRYSEPVYRLQLKNWSEFPHYSIAYFHEKTKELRLTAMTERGFEKLAQSFNGLGLALSGEVGMFVNPAMLHTAEQILQKKIEINPYRDLFPDAPMPASVKENLDQLNRLISLMIPDINTGKIPDVEKLAVKVGMDPLEAREIMDHLLKQMKKQMKR